MGGGSSPIDPGIESALAEYGAVAEQFSLVSPLGKGKGSRLAWRVDTADGRTLKARSYPSRQDAIRIFQLASALPEPFADVLACHDTVVIEEWIDGAPLDEAASDGRFEEAGSILGRLHAGPLDPDILRRTPTHGYVERAQREATTLVEAGRLQPDEARALLDEIQRRDPGFAPNALIHTDFCADNLLVTHSGDLKVIDNEHLRIGPASFDLGCTYHRWPMSEAAWEAFDRGYRSSAPVELTGFGFWQIVSTLIGARVFLEYDPDRLAFPLELLRLFAAGESLRGQAAR